MRKKKIKGEAEDTETTADCFDFAKCANPAIHGGEERNTWETKIKMFDIKENLKKLPDSPGVYIHKDRLGQVIYVGKAVSLKNRVRQYFQKSYQNTNPKVKALAASIAEFEYIKCSSEMEALILECNLIKKHMPKYNVLLRDDKTYPYIMVTVSEKFPRIVKTRLLKKDGNKYFGPYSDVGAVNRIVELLTKTYKLKSCAAVKFPKDFRPCLNYYIGMCDAPCVNEADEERYRRDIDEILNFLAGRTAPILKRLKGRMKMASEKMEYEEAAKWRDAVSSVKALSETQRVTMIGEHDLDVCIVIKEGDKSFVVLFPVRDGKLSGREVFPIQAYAQDSKANIAYEFIRQYYSQWATVPHEILTEENPKDRELLEKFLSAGGHKVRISVPQKGDKKRLLDLTKQDTVEISKTLAIREENRNEREEAVRVEMLKLIERAGYPAEEKALSSKKKNIRVESYDISNTNGIDSVGAMVVFGGLMKVKKDYRRFKVKTIEGSDDYGSLQEVIYRRFKRALDRSPGFIEMPDIIMMDGGLGQVHAAQKVLSAMKIVVPVVGMAKDESHRTRAIVFDDGSEIPLKENPTLFRYCGTIQEEVHRFAIEYHRSLHNKKAVRSALDNIPGVGEKRRNRLLYEFKSIEAIKKARVEELRAVPGITDKIAQNIVNYFHG